jgi:hypothetical protein
MENSENRNEELEKFRRRADKLVDEAPEKFIEKGVKLLIKLLCRWDDSGLWSKAYTLFYTPHIKVFSKLLAEEIRYDALWKQTTELRKSIEKYQQELEEVRQQLPAAPPGVSPTSSGIQLVQRIDGMIGGAIKLLKVCQDKVAAINRFLDVNRPHNMFDYVIGKGKNHTARNDLCYAVRDMVLEVETLVNFRNEWARYEGMVPKSASLRHRMQQQCTSTPF